MYLDDVLVEAVPSWTVGEHSSDESAKGRVINQCQLTDYCLHLIRFDGQCIGLGSWR